MEFGVLNPIWKWLMPKLVHKLRQWDFVAAQRPDFFIANSFNTASRIKKYYNRNSEVIHPCIDTKKFEFREEKEDFYLYVWRCIPYKKFDLLIDSFNKNWKQLIVVTNTPNKLQKKLQSISNNNIKWKIQISGEETRELFSKAKAFLFPPEEDFWLVPIEAMACWTPVIAYWKWWALETVVEWKTWLFFEQQTVESLNKTIDMFEKMEFDYKNIREHALGFDKNLFRKKILDFIERKID